MLTITHCEDYREGLGVNSRIQLAEARQAPGAVPSINQAHMAAGVTMTRPQDQVWMGAGRRRRAGTPELLPHDRACWGRRLGGRRTASLGPTRRLTDYTRWASGCRRSTRPWAPTSPSTSGVTCGPRAYLRRRRPPAARAPTIGHARRAQEAPRWVKRLEGAAPQLHRRLHHRRSRVNIGARLHHVQLRRCPQAAATTIGDSVFIGSDTMMVAPVTIGEGAIDGRQLLHHPRCSR